MVWILCTPFCTRKDGLQGCKSTNPAVYTDKVKNPWNLVIPRVLLVEVAGFEPTTFWSRI